MRVLVLLLLLGAVPSVAAGQAVEPGPADARAVLGQELTGESEPAAVVASPADAELASSPVVRGEVSSREAAEATQPTMGNFLYQVLLAAVTALVTALIWRAVF